MPKSRLKRFLIKFFSFLKVLAVAWMVGIANSIKQEQRSMDDTNYTVEWHDETLDDEPFDELDS